MLSIHLLNFLELTFSGKNRLELGVIGDPSDSFQQMICS